MTRPGILPDRVARTFTSPWVFSCFLLIPLFVVILRIARLPFPGTNLLLANNLLLLVYLATRLVLLLRGGVSILRYREDAFRPRRGATVPIGTGAARRALEEAGYRFNVGGTYGERRDAGYWGTVLMHGGLVLLLAFGSYDNTHLFSGSVLLGVGEPLPLYEKGVYGFWSKGLLTSYDDIAMKLQIKERLLPSSEHPEGATGIVLLSRDGRELQRGIIDPGRPMSQGNYNVLMTRFVYDCWVVVTATGNLVVYTDWLKLLPRADASGVYSHYCEFTTPDARITGRAWFDQYKDRLRVQMDKDRRRIVDVVLGMGPEYRKEAGGYVTTLQGVGKWTEFRVVRKRHVPFLIAGGVIALVGLLVRVVFRSRRVWLEAEGSGSTVRATDGRVLRTLVSHGREGK